MKQKVIVRYTLVGVLFGLIFPVIATLFETLSQGSSLTISDLLHAQVSEPLLWVIDSAPIFLGMFARWAGLRQARVLELNLALQGRIRESEAMVTELEVLRSHQDQHIERQYDQLHMVSQIARQAAAIHNPKQLIQWAVKQVADQFGFDFAGIYLVDPPGKYVLLQSASAPGDKSLPDHRDKLEIGPTSLVGQVAESGEARLAGDDEITGSSDLTETRSEMALPLKIAQETIGVLDIRSSNPAGLTAADLQNLQTLADQLSLSLENARLFSDSQQSVQHLEHLFDRQIREGWQKTLRHQKRAFRLNSQSISPAQATDETNFVVDPLTVRVPIQLGNVSIGALTLQRSSGEHPWTEAERSMLAQSVQQVALALENARLLDESRTQAERERIASQISSKVWASTDAETILRTALQEMSRSLNVAEGFIQLEVASNGNNHQATNAQSSLEEQS